MHGVGRANPSYRCRRWTTGPPASAYGGATGRGNHQHQPSGFPPPLTPPHKGEGDRAAVGALVAGLTWGGRMGAMVTILDKRAPRHPEKAQPAGYAGAAQAGLDPRARAGGVAGYGETRRVVRAHGLVTVCEEAACPNIGECWAKSHATMMIMGDICTRACAFCNVATGMPGPLDPSEPEHVADAVAKLGLEHVVITSVDRDDLADGGAEHFAPWSAPSARRTPATTVEVLTPDFLRKAGAVETVVAAKPDVFNHNLETVPRLYLSIRPGARYFASLRLLQRVKELDPTSSPSPASWSGSARSGRRCCRSWTTCAAAGVDFLTIGQYLQPTRKHAEVERFVPPDEFKALETPARQGLPDGVGKPADPLLLPRRRGLRAAAGGAVCGARVARAIRRTPHAAHPRHRLERHRQVDVGAQDRPQARAPRDPSRPRVLAAGLGGDGAGRVAGARRAPGGRRSLGNGRQLQRHVSIRVPRAEAIVWLDLSRRIYFPRAVWRIVQSNGRVRPDLAPGCPEKVDLEFLFKWVWTYPTRSRPRDLEPDREPAGANPRRGVADAAAGAGVRRRAARDPGVAPRRGRLMPAFSTTRRVAFTPRQMFDLVADVERYPQFLPLCEGLTVRKRERAGDNEVLICDMTVGYKAIRESFTSRVMLDPAALLVQAGSVPEYPSGPFRRGGEPLDLRRGARRAATSASSSPTSSNRCCCRHWSVACSTGCFAATRWPSRSVRGPSTVPLLRPGVYGGGGLAQGLAQEREGQPRGRRRGSQRGRYRRTGTPGAVFPRPCAPRPDARARPAWPRCRRRGR